MAYIKRQMESEFGIDCKPKTVINVANMLANRFARGVAKKTYNDCIFISKEDDKYSLNSEFEKLFVLVYLENKNIL
jgi:hypothetical protein